MAWKGLGGEVEDVDGVALGITLRVFKGELVVGKGVVGGRLHQAVDEHGDGTLGKGRFGEGDLGGVVHAVEGEDGRIGKGDGFLGGHDLAIGKGEADDSLGGGAAASGVGGVDTRNWEGGLGYLDSGAFLGAGRDILATLGIAADDGLDGSVHGAADGIVYLCAC